MVRARICRHRLFHAHLDLHSRDDTFLCQAAADLARALHARRAGRHLYLHVRRVSLLQLGRGGSGAVDRQIPDEDALVRRALFALCVDRGRCARHLRGVGRDVAGGNRRRDRRQKQLGRGWRVKPGHDEVLVIPDAL